MLLTARHSSRISWAFLLNFVCYSWNPSLQWTFSSVFITEYRVNTTVSVLPLTPFELITTSAGYGQYTTLSIVCLGSGQTNDWLERSYFSDGLRLSARTAAHATQTQISDRRMALSIVNLCQISVKYLSISQHEQFLFYCLHFFLSFQKSKEEFNLWNIMLFIKTWKVLIDWANTM